MPTSFASVTTGRCWMSLETISAMMPAARSVGAQVNTFAVIRLRTGLDNRSGPNLANPRTMSRSETMPSSVAPSLLTTKAPVSSNPGD